LRHGFELQGFTSFCHLGWYARTSQAGHRWDNHVGFASFAARCRNGEKFVLEFGALGWEKT